jgi:2-aminoethylphosphonate-pyruvate transaminase
MRRHQLHPILLTPGPVPLSFATKQEMLNDHDMDGPHIASELSFCRDYLLQVGHASDYAVAIPVPGCATAASEATIRTFVPAGGKLLVYSNGVFGDRLSAICQAIGLAYSTLRTPPWQPLSIAELSGALLRDPTISHVIAVHCETSTGMLNPVEEIADLCQRAGKKFLVNAVSSFGALPFNLTAMRCQAVIIGSDKCLEGPPGLAWVIASKTDLGVCKGNSRSLVHDLLDQWQYLEQHQHLKFTPPTHLVSGLAQALREHRDNGGQEARLKRYRQNHKMLVTGLRSLGLETLLPDRQAAPMLAAFIAPDLPQYDPVRFSQKLARYGCRIALRPIALSNTFLIGCMGELDENHMAAAVTAIRRALIDMGGPPPLGI